MNVNLLVADIARYAKAYYSGTPLVSDAEFDQLVEQLRAVDPNNPILTTPGWGYVPEGTKYPHVTTVGSLGKVKIYTDASKEAALKEYSNNTYTYTPKLDGGSAVAYYKDGKLDRIISRGNGSEGVDITMAVLKGGTVPLELPRLCSKIRAVRGEVIISKKDFEEHLKGEYANARNASTGISQAGESPYHKYLQFVTYYDLEDDSLNDRVVDYRDMLYHLQTAGFKIVPMYIVKTIEDLNELSPANSQYEFEVDGLVVCHNSVKVEDHITFYQSMALKFEAETAITKVTKVVWQESRLGKLTPVVEYEPVELSGATLTRASAFNARYIVDNGINEGALIKICRSNEVIPYILEVVEKKEPSIPEFWNGKPTLWSGVDIRVNPDTEFQCVWNLISSCLEFGCGWNTIKVVLDKYRITTLTGLIELCDRIDEFESDIVNDLGVRGQKAVKSFRNILNKAWKLSEILVNLNLYGLGWAAAVALETHYKDKDSMLKDLRELNDISEDAKKVLPTYVPAESIRKECKYVEYALSLPLKYAEYQPEIKQEAKIKITLTGKLSKPRSQLLEDWKDYGVVEVDISQADYLVTDNPNSGSSKNQKADKLGIKKITEQEFNELLQRA